MIKVYENIMLNETFDFRGLGCEKAFAKIAIVRVQLSSNRVTKIITSKRVSFTDHIASLGKILKNHKPNHRLFMKTFLGGTLGLFTGMSIMSMLELVFWIARLLFGLTRHRDKKLTHRTG